MPELAARTGQWCRARPEAAVAVLLTAVGAATLAVNGLLTSIEALPAAVSVLGAIALLGWCRRRPVLITMAIGVLLAVPDLTTYASSISNSDVVGASEFIVVFICAYTLGADGRWLRSLIGLVPLTAGLALAVGQFNPLAEMMTVGPWLAGLAVGSRRRAEARLAWRARELEQERELFATLSVRYERARIARELHDIVAHSVSLMVVQAGAGEHLAHQDPAGAAEAFEAISGAAREAEGEIDRLVQLLDSPPPAGPPAGLRIVEELVRRVKASGLLVSCQFVGESDDWPDVAAQTVYRVVQESVTNVVKHAPGAPIGIVVRGRSDTIEVEISNRPTFGHRSGLEGSGGGHGLVGMRERVARCGGTFDAGPTADGGWRVAACLPRYPHGQGTAPTDAASWP